MFHLVKRFFGSLSHAPVEERDQVWIREVLNASEFEIWQSQALSDRRHSRDIAGRFVAMRPQATQDEIAGALLHDIGKIEANLGTIARVTATLIPLPTRRFRAYRLHEQNGAKLLKFIGSSDTTIALVAGHPDSEALRALKRVDDI